MKISHPNPLYLFIFLLCSACQPVKDSQTEVNVDKSLLNSSFNLPDNRLRVGTVYGRQTYHIGPNGPTGFEYELALGFAEFLGTELEMLAFLNFEELEKQLERGKLDIIASGVGQPKISNDSLNSRLGPKYQSVSHEVVFLQGENRPRSLSDLNGSLSVVAGSGHAKSVQLHSAELTDVSVDYVNDQDAEELLVAVAEGQLPYTATDSNALSIVRRRYPDLSIGFTLDESLPVAWKLQASGDHALQALLFEYIAEMRASGEMAQLEDKYFGHVRSFDFVDTKAFIEAAKTKLPEYVDTFKAASVDLDWRLLAALSYQESHWDPKAVSPTGVRGMMMLTQATAKDWDVSSRLDPLQSISGGARYFSSLTKRVPARIQSPDRIWMALAAYNIGLGHLEDARVLTQRHGGDPDIWVDVKKRLPLLQQKRYYSKTRYGYARGSEALRYVENIRRYYDTLVWLDNQSPVWGTPLENSMN